MSRIAKKGIVIPAGTTVTLTSGVITVKGPKGELSRKASHLVDINIVDNSISFVTKNNTLEARSSIGTTAAHLKNMIKGVNEMYIKKLILEGVGYKMETQGENLKMALGFSHPVVVAIPKGISIVIEKGNMTISGIDKDLVGEFSAKIRDLKKPEPYKGKGFRYDNEVIRRKQGKKAV